MKTEKEIIVRVWGDKLEEIFGQVKITADPDRNVKLIEIRKGDECLSCNPEIWQEINEAIQIAIKEL